MRAPGIGSDYQVLKEIERADENVKNVFSIVDPSNGEVLFILVSVSRDGTPRLEHVFEKLQRKHGSKYATFYVDDFGGNKLSAPASPFQDKRNDTCLSLIFEVFSNLFKIVLASHQGRRDDDFFHAGGDSISLVKLVKVSERSNIDISIFDVIETRTPTALSKLWLARKIYALPSDCPKESGTKKAGAIQAPPISQDLRSKAISIYKKITE
jgi:hypothetical protein